MRRTHFAIMLSLLLVGSGPAFAADPKKPDAKKGDAKAGEAAAPPPPPTEYGRICQADVSYLWQLEESSSGAARKVFYATVSEQGSLVEDIKAKLNARLASVQAQAIDACRGDHQSKSGCVVRKLSTVSTSFPGLDFASRQLTMNSVRKDCNQRIGRCLSTQISEMKCWLYVPSEAIIPDEPKVHVEQGPQPELDEEEVDVTDDAEEAVEEALTSKPGGGAVDSSTGAPKIKIEKPTVPKKVKVKRPKAPDDKSAPQETPTPEQNPYNQPFSL